MEFFSRCKKSIWSPPLMRYWHKNCSFSPFSVCRGRRTFDRLRVYSTPGERQGSGQIHAHARDAEYSVLLSFPLSSEYRAWVYVVLRVPRVGVSCPLRIAHGCVLSSEYRAWVCFLLVSRVAVCFPVSIVRGFVLSSEYRACVRVHFARSLVFRRN